VTSFRFGADQPATCSFQFGGADTRPTASWSTTRSAPYTAQARQQGRLAGGVGDRAGNDDRRAAPWRRIGQGGRRNQAGGGNQE
jgi:hypothetical protein